MAQSQQNDLLELEKKLIEKQDKLDKKIEAFDEEKEAIEDLKEKYKKKLEQVSGLTRDEAQKALIAETEKDSAAMVARIIKEGEEEAKHTAAKKAQEILLDSLKHGALNYVAEYTVSVVKIQDEEVKGRIIGKEGRNIRAFEQATGVDVDLDEEGIIRLSSFDSVRREIAADKKRS